MVAHYCSFLPGKQACTSVGLVLHSQINTNLVLPIDEVAAGDVDSSGEPIDAKLYTTFWGLQSLFKVRRTPRC